MRLVGTLYAVRFRFVAPIVRWFSGLGRRLAWLLLRDVIILLALPPTPRVLGFEGPTCVSGIIGILVFFAFPPTARFFGCGPRWILRPVGLLIAFPPTAVVSRRPRIISVLRSHPRFRLGSLLGLLLGFLLRFRLFDFENWCVCRFDPLPRAPRLLVLRRALLVEAFEVGSFSGRCLVVDLLHSLVDARLGLVPGRFHIVTSVLARLVMDMALARLKQTVQAVKER